MARRAVARARESNAAYRAANPDRAFPDPLLIYEVAGHPYTSQFDETGAEHAALIAGLLREQGVGDAPRLLEWGCGPARILGHMRTQFPRGALFGCDPEARGVAFAANAYRGIAFTRSAFAPPAPYAPAGFDAIYGVSIFTHLDEASANAWAGDLARMLDGQGVVLVTTHGDAAAARLTGRTRENFEAGRYVVLGGASEGSRTFAAYMNERAGRALFGAHFGEITFRPARPDELGQDIWLMRQPKRA